MYANLIGLFVERSRNCDTWKVMEMVCLDPRIEKSHNACV